MRKSLAALALMMMLPVGSSLLCGCGNGGDYEVKDDPKVSETKRVDYENQMKEAMKNVNKGGRKGGKK